MYISSPLRFIFYIMYRATGNQPIDTAYWGQNPGRPDVKDPNPHLCELPIGNWPTHEKQIHVACHWHADPGISFAQIKFRVCGKVANARANHVADPHQQPWSYQPDCQYYRNSENEQRQLAKSAEEPIYHLVQICRNALAQRGRLGKMTTPLPGRPLRPASSHSFFLIATKRKQIMRH